MARRYRSIARVEKTHGRQGEIVAVDVNGLGTYLRPGMWVWAVPPRLKGPRSFVVGRVRGNGHGWLVSLVGVDSITHASRLVGRTLLVAVDELPDDFELHDARELVGRQVRDLLLGEIGHISEVTLGVANDAWTIEGETGTFVIPVVGEYVLGIDNEGELVVNLPDGVREGRDG